MKVFITAICLISTVLLSGCNQVTVREESGLVQGSTIDQSDQRATLILGSEALVGNVRLVSPKFRSIGELTQAQVTVQSLTDTKLTLEYKFVWQDAQGFQEGGAGSWHRFTLTPRQVISFNSTGKVPEASNIVFTVRLPDDFFISPPAQKEGQ
jgi:uncharacterized protein YcfL